MVTLHARNFCVLRQLRWPLDSLSVLTGANGAGKTTALLALKVLRTAFDRGLAEAVSLTLGGSYNLRHRDAGEDEPVELGLDIDTLSWRIRLVARGATVDSVTEESLTDGGHPVFQRDSLGNFFYRGERQDLSPFAAERLGLRWMEELQPEDVVGTQMAGIVRRIQVFYDPDLRGLRESGSRATEDRHLHSRGRNVFSMLRKWRDRRTDRARFEFVHEGMLAAFPGVYESLDFDAGQTITARVYRPGSEMATPINYEANGVLAMLVLLSQVASAAEGGVIAIDEPENSLHPFAIRRFMRRSRAWAERRRISIVLTTHSPVLLDELNECPDRVFVMEHGHETLPVRLDKIRDPAWLKNYTLGELYTGGEFASVEMK